MGNRNNVWLVRNSLQRASILNHIKSLLELWSPYHILIEMPDILVQSCNLNCSCRSTYMVWRQLVIQDECSYRNTGISQNPTSVHNILAQHSWLVVDSETQWVLMLNSFIHKSESMAHTKYCDYRPSQFPIISYTSGRYFRGTCR